MKPEEAIELLENLKVCKQAHTLFNIEKEAVDMAIEALKTHDGLCDNLAWYINERNRLLQAQRKHGEWLSHYEYCKKHEYIPSGLIAFWWCNKCEQGVEIPTNFCPNCGASMSANDRQVTGKLNSEIENSKSEIVPDYRDGWRMRGEAE